MGGSVVPLLKVERLGKPFEGVIAMRDTSFEPLAETVGQAASSVAIIESERRPALRVTVLAAIFAGVGALGRFGVSTSMRSS
jgi:hypothetical protein